MKKNFLISRLISIVFVFIPTFALAQDDEPAIKIKTETYNGGITVETYEKGTSEYKVYKRKNGDYYMDIKPYEMQWTLKDKTLIKGNGDDLRIKFPNGNILYMSQKHYISSPIDKYEFVNPDIVDMPTLWKHLSGDQMIGFADVNNHPGKSYPIVEKRTDDHKVLHLVYIDKNVFELDINGNLLFAGKEVDGFDKTRNESFKCLVYAISSDSIIDCVRYVNDKEDAHSKRKEEYTKISYANGDEVYLTGGYLGLGTHIHRGYGLLTIKGKSENDRNCYINFIDGRIFKTNDLHGFKEAYWFLPILLKYENLTPYSGTLINKDNTGVVIKEGMTQEEREKRSELARKKEEASKKADYELLCKAYGKKYVDAAMKGNLIIGTPENLFLLGYPNTRLRQQTQGTKVYEVRNILNKITKVVRVRNGRVSGVTNY